MEKLLFSGKIGVLLCLSFLVFFLVGVAIVRLWKKNISISESIVVGFIICLSLYQVLAFPFIVKNGLLSVLTYTYISILILICLYSCFLIYKKQVYIKTIQVTLSHFLAVTLLIGIALTASYLHSVEADDSYYISVSTYAYEQNRVCLDQTEITTGMDYISATPRPQVSAWEVFLASWSKIFAIKPIIFAHSIFPIIAIILTFLAYRQIAKLIFLEEEERNWFMIFFLCVILFSGYSSANMGSFLLMRSWQGKSVLVAVVLPSLLVACYRMLSSKNKKWYHWAYNGVLLIAGVCCNPVGMYLTSLLYLMVAVSYLFIASWKEIREMILGAICSVIPVGMLAFYSLINLVNGTAGSYLHAEGKKWREVFLDYWQLQDGVAVIFFILFTISLFVFSFEKDKILKAVFWRSTILVVVILLNPALYNFISKKITGVDVYWRLYWLLPFYATVPCMLVKIKRKVGEKQSWITGIGICLILSVLGSNVFAYEGYFSEHKNLERIPTEVKKLSNYIIEQDENCVVLFPKQYSEYLRQYTSKIKTPYSRGLYNGNRELNTIEYTLDEFYIQLYYGNITNPDVIVKVLDELEVDYLMVNKNLKLRKCNKLIELKELCDCYVYEVVK